MSTAPAASERAAHARRADSLSRPRGGKTSTFDRTTYRALRKEQSGREVELWRMAQPSGEAGGICALYSLAARCSQRKILSYTSGQSTISRTKREAA